MSNELNTTNGASNNGNGASAAQTLAEKIRALSAQQAAQAAAQPTGANRPPIVRGASHDALGGLIGAGTHAMHVTLAECYAQGVTVTLKQLIELSGYTNAPNHSNTMKNKGRLIAQVRGQLRLSDAAGQAWHGEGRVFGFAGEAAKLAEAAAQAAEAAKQAEELAKAEAAKQAEELARAEETARKGKKGK